MSSPSSPQNDAQGGEKRAAPLTSDQLLPPVEPPSAGFIIQLFVIPAVIVAAVVALWLLIETLASGGEQNPDAIIAGLRSGQARFQQAKELADMLRMPERYRELKDNRELAQKLGALLDEKVAAGDDAEAEVTMRIFLCTALGEFHVDDGLPTLIRAAQEDPERDVRRRAINAIAVLAGGLAKLKPPQYLQSEELTAALVKLADEQDELIRSETAFAIGVVAARPEADAELIAALEALADDPYTDARFNAAIGLARVGSPRAAAALAEMLDPESLAASTAGEKAMTAEVTPESVQAHKAYKRNTILHNAIAAIEMAEANGSFSAGDRRLLAAALRSMASSAADQQDLAPLPRELVDALNRTAEKLSAAATDRRASPEKEDEL
jgi:hypothetical protein